MISFSLEATVTTQTHNIPKLEVAVGAPRSPVSSADVRKTIRISKLIVKCSKKKIWIQSGHIEKRDKEI